MKKTLLALLVGSLLSACSPGQAPTPTPVSTPAASLPYREPDPMNPPPGRLRDIEASNAFILVGYQDSIIQGERIENIGIKRDPDAKGAAGYKAASVVTMDGNEPDALTLSVPFPPEVNTASDDSIEVYYSCDGSEEASGFRIRAPLTSIDFYASGEYPRAEIKTGEFRLMFATCAPAKVTVRVVFLNEQAGGEFAWVLLSLERGQAAKQ